MTVQIVPRWWVRVKNISGFASGVFETEDAELKSEKLVPAYDQAQIESAVVAERVRWRAEIEPFLVAAADGSMSRNNSEALAEELLEWMRKA